MKTKRNINLLLCIILFLLTTGCTMQSGVITMGSFKARGNQITGKYHKFSGHYAKRIKLRENQMLEIIYEEITDKGSIKASITDKKGNEVQELSPSSENFNFIPPEEGMYYIRVDGDKHGGSFKIMWNKVSNES